MAEFVFPSNDNMTGFVFPSTDNITGFVFPPNGTYVDSGYGDYWSFIQTAFIISITILIIFTNLVDIIVIGFHFENFSLPECFMVSLACADLGVGVLVAPFSIKSSIYHQWMYSDAVCGVVGILLATFCAVSIYSLVLISADRYMAILYPLRYVSLMTMKKGYALIALTWLISVAIFVTYKLTAGEFYFDQKSSVCGINFPAQGEFTLFIVLTVVLPPVFTLCYVYWKIFLAARRQRCKIDEMSPPMSFTQTPVNLDQGSSPLREINLKIKRARDLNKAKMYFFIIGSFLVAWIPYSLLQVILCTTTIDVAQPVVFIIQWTAMANSFWNSIIYFLMSKKYRQGCFSTWKYIKNCHLCNMWRKCKDVDIKM